MSIEDKRRAAFEAAVLAKWPKSGLDIIIRKMGIYLDYTIRTSWHFYNAALDSVVIELPDALEDDLTLIESIESAGMKVKP